MASQQTPVTNMSDSTRSPFLALPPELRNKIYESAFSADDFHVQAIEGQFTKLRRKLPKAEIINPPNLLLANKQTYSEARQLFYATATFQFPASDHRDYCHKLVKSFFKHLPDDHAPLISKIRIHVSTELWQHRWVDQMLIGKGVQSQNILENVAKAVDRPSVAIQINVWLDGALAQRIANEWSPRIVDYYKQRCGWVTLECVWTQHPQLEMEREHRKVQDLVAERETRYFRAWQKKQKLLSDANQAALRGFQAQI